MTNYLIKEDVFMAITGDITDCTVEEYISRLRDKLSKLPSINVTTNEDCISREGLLKAFKDECRGECDNCHHFRKDDGEYKCRLIADFPSVTPKKKTCWIPVNERLPEIGIDVLACDIEGIIYMCHRTPHDNYFYAWGCKIKDIIAWIPLPKPYKTESE